MVQNNLNTSSSSSANLASAEASPSLSLIDQRDLCRVCLWRPGFLKEGMVSARLMSRLFLPDEWLEQSDGHGYRDDDSHGP